MIIPTAAGNDIFLIGTNLATQTQVLLKVVVIALAIAFVLYNAVTHKMSVSRLIVTLLAAGLLVWGVNNIEFLQGATNDTLDQGAARPTSEAGPAPVGRT